MRLEHSWRNRKTHCVHEPFWFWLILAWDSIAVSWASNIDLSCQILVCDLRSKGSSCLQRWLLINFELFRWWVQVQDRAWPAFRFDSPQSDEMLPVPCIVGWNIASSRWSSVFTEALRIYVSLWSHLWPWNTSYIRFCTLYESKQKFLELLRKVRQRKMSNRYVKMFLYLSLTSAVEWFLQRVQAGLNLRLKAQ